jgi:hypothetical protein
MSRSESDRSRRRTWAVSLGALAIAALVGIVGFGSLASADETSATATPAPSAALRPHHHLTADQEACLKGALGDLPMPTPGSPLTIPTQDEINKLKDAASSCGITLPAGHHLGGGAGSPGLTTDQKTCLEKAIGDLLPAPGSPLTMPTPDQIKADLGKLKDAASSCGVTLPAGHGFGAGVGAGTI